MHSDQKMKGIISRGSIFLVIALVLTYFMVLVPLSVSKDDNSHGANFGGPNFGGPNFGGPNFGGYDHNGGKPCTDECGRPQKTSSTTTEYQTVKFCFNVPVSHKVKDCHPETICTGKGKQKVCKTEMVCSTKTVWENKEICTEIKMKRDCTTTTTYQDCTKMTKCDHTGCNEDGTYTKVLSEKTTCTGWSFVSH